MTGERGVAAAQPDSDGLSQRRDSADWWIAPELAQMLFERRPEKGRDQRLRLPEGKVDRQGSGLDALEQGSKARERRGDEIVERVEFCLNRHAEGLRDGARSGNG